MIGNSELQERMAEQMEFALSQTPEALATENAKLRELVRDMWGWLTARTVGGAALHDISGRMRDMGVEVDA